MDIKLNINKIHSNDLSPTLFCFLYYVQANMEFPWKLSETQLNSLQDAGWIKLIKGTPYARAKFRNTFKKELETLLTKENVEDWIEEWRALWPSGVKSASRPVRGDKQGVLKKMKLFTAAYPDMDKLEIFNATKVYVYEKQQSNYKFMTCADYFISKDGVSLLASWVETLRLNKHSLLNSESGGGPFHKEI